jgi:hypothetical protein
MIVTTQQVAKIRAGKVTVALIPPAHAAAMAVGRPARMRRHVLDGDGRRTKELVTVTEVKAGAEDRVPVLVTPVAFSEIQALTSVTLAEAQRAGFQTTADLVATWREMYPRTRIVVSVVFALGDTRDRPRFMAMARKDGSITSDYTGSRTASLDPDAEVVSDAVLAKFGKEANEERLKLLRAATKSIKEAHLERPQSRELARQVRHLVHIAERVEATITALDARV